MSDVILVDGYNLIHALGMIQHHMPRGGLEASRRRLLEFLATAFQGRDAIVTVVFDARSGNGKRSLVQAGMYVQFSGQGESADDLIERMIDENDDTDQLIVVSNDARLQHAAKRAGARPWSHDDLLDFLQRRPAKPAAVPVAEKAFTASPAEIRRWIAEFKPLERDPRLKEFFDIDKFEGDEPEA